MNYKKRLKRLQAAIKRRKQGAMLVCQPENRRYLTGYCGGDHGISESSGALLVPARGDAHLVTDFRFKLQAEMETPQTQLHIHKKGILPALAKLLTELDIKSLIFESDYTLHSVAQKMEETLKKQKISLLPTEGLIEKMRVIKDEDEIDALRKSVRLNEQVFERQMLPWPWNRQCARWERSGQVLIPLLPPVQGAPCPMPFPAPTDLKTANR